MSVHISDSIIFQNAWSTPELRELFDDISVIKGWIEIMVVLAETEAEFGLIPSDAARKLANTSLNLQFDEVFFAEVRKGYEQSNHSLLGLIRALQNRSPENSGEWWCYGATVQDITDTHTARLLLAVHKNFTSRIDKLIDVLRGLAQRYRETPMCGRTHGQPGLPITFGYKVAGWLDEIHRHRLRLAEIKSRIGAGQIAGGVGSLSSFGPDAPTLQQVFLDTLGLSIPAISWTSSRDRLAEWLNLMMLITATSDRIGHEVYNLQRPEIGELSEGFVKGTVGSITMPQKRNPEISEHLGTLSRFVRHQASFMNENLVHDHERDGRSWKSEWAILPGACLATGKALSLLEILLTHLQVNKERMAENLAATKGSVKAEQFMLVLAPILGKQTAHSLVYQAAMTASERAIPFRDALLSDARVASALKTAEIDHIFATNDNTGCCVYMIDRVVAETGTWSSGQLQKH